MKQTQVVVIGAGLGGLSTAVHLAGAGYGVTVYDRQSGPGGKAFSERVGRYRFDTGPSLFTLKRVFDELFSTVGRNFDDYVSARPLDPICSYFWSDGTRLAARGNEDRLAREFGRVMAADGDTEGDADVKGITDQVTAFLRYSARIYDITAELFLERSLHDWRTYASGRFWKSLVQFPWIDPFRTMERATGSFFADPRIRQFFNRYATYNGSDPYRTPATLNIIPHVEYGIGAWEIDGGIYTIPQAIETVARELGVSFHYDTPVTRIIRDRSVGGRVTGIEVDGTIIPAAVVISNVDVTVTYRDLLEDVAAPLFRRYGKLEPSSSGIVFYWGMNRQFPELGLHNVFFSDNYRTEFEELFQRYRTPSDPTIYINITSKTSGQVHRDAPEGCENWFVLVNAPADFGQDWNEEVRKVRGRIVSRLNRLLGRDVGAAIEVESVLTPPEIAERTGSYRGSLYGIASNTRLAAFLRHPNRSRRHRGLYLVGGSAHPGGGMPLVVLGGKITAGLVQRDIPPGDVPPGDIPPGDIPPGVSSPGNRLSPPKGLFPPGRPPKLRRST